MSNIDEAISESKYRNPSLLLAARGSQTGFVLFVYLDWNFERVENGVDHGFDHGPFETSQAAAELGQSQTGDTFATDVGSEGREAALNE